MFEFDDGMLEKIDVPGGNFVEYSLYKFLEMQNISKDLLEIEIKTQQVKFTMFNRAKSGLSFEALEILTILIKMCSGNDIHFELEKYSNEKKTPQIEMIISEEDLNLLNSKF